MHRVWVGLILVINKLGMDKYYLHPSITLDAYLITNEHKMIN